MQLIKILNAAAQCRDRDRLPVNKHAGGAPGTSSPELSAGAGVTADTFVVNVPALPP